MILLRVHLPSVLRPAAGLGNCKAAVLLLQLPALPCPLPALQDFQLLRPLAALTGRIRTLRVRCWAWVQAVAMQRVMHGGPGRGLLASVCV